MWRRQSRWLSGCRARAVRRMHGRVHITAQASLNSICSSCAAQKHSTLHSPLCGGLCALCAAPPSRRVRRGGASWRTCSGSATCCSRCALTCGAQLRKLWPAALAAGCPVRACARCSPPPVPRRSAQPKHAPTRCCQCPALLPPQAENATTKQSDLVRVAVRARAQDLGQPGGWGAASCARQRFEGARHVAVATH